MKHPSGFLKVIKCKKLMLTRLSYTHNVNMKTYYGEGSTCVCVSAWERKGESDGGQGATDRKWGTKTELPVCEKRELHLHFMWYMYMCVRVCVCVVSVRRNLSHNTEECFGFLSNINRIHTHIHTYTWKSLDNRVMSVVPCLVSCHLELVSRCGPRQIHLQSNLEMCPHVPHKIFLRI